MFKDDPQRDLVMKKCFVFYSCLRFSKGERVLHSKSIRQRKATAVPLWEHQPRALQAKGAQSRPRLWGRTLAVGSEGLAAEFLIFIVFFTPN